MIVQLEKYKKPWVWVLIHIFLGYVSTFSNIFLISYFYFFLLSSLISTIQQNLSSKIPLLLAYLVPFEIICRMANTSPFIPYELSKYLQFILLMIGIFNGNVKGKFGFLMLLLLLPALTYDMSNEVSLNGYVFNFLGPINLCLGIIYFFKLSMTKEEFSKIIKAIILPLTSALVFAYIQTPDYDKLEFQLGANFETTGGFGSNQISTVFGLGAFLSFVLWYYRISISNNRLFDTLLLLLFILQGLLSFSRGGMLGGFIGILIFLFYDYHKNKKIGVVSNFRFGYLISALFVVFAVMWYANELTDGKLLLRYQGETEGTLKGTKVKTLNTITTNRSDMFEGDWNLFIENPLGVGVGASKYLRKTENGVVSHVEMSRLVSEHGYLGMLFFMILTLLPLRHFRDNFGKNPYRPILISIFFIAWFTTFHAATRNFVTPLLIGLSLVNIKRDESTLLRK